MCMCIHVGVRLPLLGIAEKIACSLQLRDVNP